ncbi:MAG: hypothetical protein OXU23_17720 [Candidatus Poribacteria bacterium]|nr:hypothetical protein [Candidatus Poribacteria bacterium]
MRIPFSLYDFLGYALPGLIVIVIATILVTTPLEVNGQAPVELWLDALQTLVDPGTTSENEKDSAENELAKSLPATIIRMILYVLACYLVGFAAHGANHWMFGILSRIWDPLKRYHADSGMLEEALFCQSSRIYPEDFEQYTEQFVHKLRYEFRKVFGINIYKIQETEKDTQVVYTEIFNLLRTTVLRYNEGNSRRISALLARYNSAKLMGSIFFLASAGFLVRLFVPPQYLQWTSILISIWLIVPSLILMRRIVSRRKKESCKKKETKGKWKIWILKLFSILKPFSLYWLLAGSSGFIAFLTKKSNVLLICYCLSAVLCPIFFHLYHVLFRYYRNTILCGFYEYAVTQEKSVESKDREN